MYNYPMPAEKNYFSPKIVSNECHSMGESLYPYLKMKIHTSLDFDKIDEINIIGYYDRKSQISNNEKKGKLFNYKRPTLNLVGRRAEIRCFPGIDYVYHYSNIYSTFAHLVNRNLKITCDLPKENICWNEICKSNLKEIPKTNTVIMGYVEELEFLSNDKYWIGNGNFLYKHIYMKSGNAILLGCKHTYWGEIAGRIVLYLYQLGVKRIIYVGKLGTLNPTYLPNEVIATGDISLLPNGTFVKWNNLFDKVDCPTIAYGSHITIPSVLQETKHWAENIKNDISFVDPEIGHMAYAASKVGVQYSYLHIVSDNLLKKYTADLSNERDNIVVAKRKNLISIVGNLILEL